MTIKFNKLSYIGGLSRKKILGKNEEKSEYIMYMFIF